MLDQRFWERNSYSFFLSICVLDCLNLSGSAATSSPGKGAAPPE